MNKNPRLIKSFITGKIPFIKGKTLSLYSKYFSENKLIKVSNTTMGSDGDKLKETLSAYSLRNPADLVFDDANISIETYFTNEEWIYLGMVLRAYKEVEKIDLMHLYNCLYKSSEKISYGQAVTGRTYTLYTNTQFPVKFRIYYDGKLQTELSWNSVQASDPKKFQIPVIKDRPLETLVDIEIEFTIYPHHQASLFEGEYGGLTLGALLGKSSSSRSIIPEQLKEGEYSSKLIEFVSGTLITPISNDKLVSYLSNKLILKNGETLWKKTKNLTPGIFNIDGYMDRRVDL